ncbi:MAG: OmpA family protein [Myxococcota bacterium]
MVWAALAPVAMAAGNDADGCKDPPFLTRYPGSTIHECQHKDFERRELTVGEEKTQALEGAYDYLQYWPVGAGVTGLQLHRNYSAALKKAGFTLVYDDKQGHQTGRLKKGSEEMWIEIASRDGPNADGEAELHIVRVKSMEQKIDATDAASFLQALNDKGSVSVYGINFETGKAAITTDSAKVLREISKLLEQNPKLELLVEGHTDSVGGIRFNIELSMKRAAAVKDWLVKNGCDAKRLVSHGVGDRYPVSGNDTEAGRAKNRRVELVKL